MKTLEMKITGADVRSTKAGDRDYLKVQFKGDFNGKPLTASMNLNDTDENIDLVSDLIEKEFTTPIEFDETKIATGNFQGKEFHATDVINKGNVKEAMGIKKNSIADALKNKRNQMNTKINK